MYKLSRVTPFRTDNGHQLSSLHRLRALAESFERVGDHGGMTFDPTAPVLALIIEPTDEVATLRPVAVNTPGGIGAIIRGSIEAIELDGGSVLWLDESGKNLGLPTNLLATKIAHRLHAGLFPDDTINGRALIVGEAPGPHGDLVSIDVTPPTLAALSAAGVDVISG